MKNILLISILIAIIISGGIIYNKIPKQVCVDEYVTYSFFPNDYSFLEHYDLKKYEILCEDGIEVNCLESLGYCTISNCLKLINGNCAGEGKVCLITEKNTSCEVIYK